MQETKIFRRLKAGGLIHHEGDAVIFMFSGRYEDNYLMMVNFQDWRYQIKLDSEENNTQIGDIIEDSYDLELDIYLNSFCEVTVEPEDHLESHVLTHLLIKAFKSKFN